MKSWAGVAGGGGKATGVEENLELGILVDSLDFNGGGRGRALLMGGVVTTGNGYDASFSDLIAIVAGVSSGSSSSSLFITFTASNRPPGPRWVEVISVLAVIGVTTLRFVTSFAFMYVGVTLGGPTPNDTSLPELKLPVLSLGCNRSEVVVYLRLSMLSLLSLRCHWLCAIANG